MDTKKLTFTGLILLLIAAGAYVWYVALRPTPPVSTSTNNVSEVSSQTYLCNDDKSIATVFYKDDTVALPIANEPPTPNGSVHIRLNDGRTFSLPQTLSASGIRYANADESIIFWSKGNSAFIEEGNQKTYTGCIVTAEDSGGLPRVFENGSDGFSIRYPADYGVNTDYQYQAFGPGKEIGGASFTIPPAIAEGTNLSKDSYVSVEAIPQTQTCDAGLFLTDSGQGINLHEATEDGVTYSVASSTGAGAGNRYEETVYAIPGTNPCLAVRYLLHTTVLENYPPDTVTAYDRDILLAQFDAIRKTLVIGQ